MCTNIRIGGTFANNKCTYRILLYEGITSFKV